MGPSASICEIIATVQGCFSNVAIVPAARQAYEGPNMKRILAVATSNATELNGKKTGLWLSELTHFLAVVVDAGFAYDLASPLGGKVPLDEKSLATLEKDPVNVRFMKDPAFTAQLEASLEASAVDPARYAAIYLAGGHGTMWDFRQSGDLQRVITALYSAGKHVTAVCHGVAGLVDATDATGKVIVKDRRVTGFSNFEDRLGGTKKLMPYLLEDALKGNGAKYHKNVIPFTERVEVDGVLITGQNPQSARAVRVALVGQLKG
jgi:putative intracellular protease/amidase